jgi:hypothetical protein
MMDGEFLDKLEFCVSLSNTNYSMGNSDEYGE